MSLASDALDAVIRFARLMAAHGRDEYGPVRSPLFVGQLNTDTRRIPARTADDPGVLAGHPELAGCGPTCSNLLFDLGLFDAEGHGYFDTLDITTGKPVIGPSRHYPTIHRPRHLEAWVACDNSIKLVALAVTSGAAYALTGDDRLRMMFDRAIGLLDIPRRTRQATPLIAGDAAGVILALLHVARRGGDRGEHALAAALVEHALAHNYRNKVITTGIDGDRRYYVSRAGCGDLAAALLAFALAGLRRDDPLPPIRQPLGVMPW